MHFNKLGKRCNREIARNDPILWQIGTTMLKKLNQYMPFVVTDQVELAWIVDPWFGNDFIRDSNIRRRYFFLLIEVELDSLSGIPSRTKSPLEKLMDKWSLDEPADEIIFQFLKAISKKDMGVDPLGWYICNKARFPHARAIEKDVNALQSDFVASESSVSCAGNIISDDRSVLEDDIILACMCSPSWTTIFTS